MLLLLHKLVSLQFVFESSIISHLDRDCDFTFIFDAFDLQQQLLFKQVFIDLGQFYCSFMREVEYFEQFFYSYFYDLS